MLKKSSKSIQGARRTIRKRFGTQKPKIDPTFFQESSKIRISDLLEIADTTPEFQMALTFFVDVGA